MRLVKTALAASLLALTLPSFANVVLNFDNLADATAIGQNYAGFSFSESAYALGAATASGSGGYFANPSSPNAMGLFDVGGGQASVIINVADGFGDWFKAAFTQRRGVAGMISVYSGLNGQDAQGGSSVLASYDLTNRVDGAGGCALNLLCNWTNASLSFAGTAYSVRITGGTFTSFFDNLDFGNKPGGNTRLPEPAGLALAVSALGLAAAARRRRQA